MSARRIAGPKPVKTLAILPGCHDHGHADWLIGPVGQHRDSDVVERSNWITTCKALAAIDPDELDHEIHRFGHWAVGWVEELATRPDSACATLASELRARLESYPILDDDHHSMLESEDAYEAWPQTWRDLRADIEPIIAGKLAPSDVGAIDEYVSDKLDEITDDQAWEASHEHYTEIVDGCYRFGHSAREAIANALIAAGYFADMTATE